MIDYQEIFNTDGISYNTYRKLIDEKLAEGVTTGNKNSESLVAYTKLNVHRMDRLDKTVTLSSDLVDALKNLNGHFKILVITEGWCGDAAQIVPILVKMVSAAADKFELKIVLRDEHEELTNAHLTNGGKSIPIILFLDPQENKVLAKWGPRPEVLKHLLADWKKETTDMEILAEKLHGWYAKDKTKEIQKEFIELLKGLNG